MGLRKRLGKLKKKIDLLNVKTPLQYQVLSHRRLGSGIVYVHVLFFASCALTFVQDRRRRVLGSDYGNLDNCNLLTVPEVSWPLVRLEKPEGTQLPVGKIPVPQLRSAGTLSQQR